MNIRKLSIDQKKLRCRILEISYKAGVSHIGSCISVIDVIHVIYQIKKAEDRFVLSNGHAGVALYTVLEKNGILKNANLDNLHIHPDRNAEIGIDVSSGSLGQGLPIAVGMALANRNRIVFCIISDGECAEGSIWEALRVAVEQKLGNLIIVVNANGWGAYDPVPTHVLIKRLKGYLGYIKVIDGHSLKEIKKVLSRTYKNKPLVIVAKTSGDHLPFLKGQDAHYYVMTEEDYLLAREVLQ